MPGQKNREPTKNDFPAGLSQPALRAFAAAGYTRLDQFTKITESELLKLHGVGPKAIRLLRAALQAQGKSFAPPHRSP